MSWLSVNSQSPTPLAHNVISIRFSILLAAGFISASLTFILQEFCSVHIFIIDSSKYTCCTGFTFFPEPYIALGHWFLCKKIINIPDGVTGFSNTKHRLFHNVACIVHVYQVIIYNLTQNCAHINVTKYLNIYTAKLQSGGGHHDLQTRQFRGPRNTPILSCLSCHARRDLFRAPVNTEPVYVTRRMNRYLESMELCSLMVVVDATDQYVGT